MVGKSFTQEIIVQAKDAASVYGSGKLEVFATPAMVGLMENTAIKCIDGLLEKGYDTVGIEINVKHLKATPIGEKVTCTEIDGQRIRFLLEAKDNHHTIWTAVHDRFIIDPEKFMSKLI